MYCIELSSLSKTELVELKEVDVNGVECKRLIFEITNLINSLSNTVNSLIVDNKKFEDIFFNETCETSYILKNKSMLKTAVKLSKIYMSVQLNITKLNELYSQVKQCVAQLKHPIQYLTVILPAGATTEIWNQLDNKNGYNGLVRQQHYRIRCCDQQFVLMSLNDYHSTLKQYDDIHLNYKNITDKISKTTFTVIKDFIELNI